MKIDKNYANYLNSVKQTKSEHSNEAKKTEQSTKKQANVEVNISKEAQALLDADQVTFSEKVQSIKAAIQNGEYEVDASKISAELVRTIQTQKEQ